MAIKFECACGTAGEISTTDKNEIPRCPGCRQPIRAKKSVSEFADADELMREVLGERK